MISRQTVKDAAAVIRGWMDAFVNSEDGREQVDNLLSMLTKVKGNQSFRDSIRAIRAEVNDEAFTEDDGEQLQDRRHVFAAAPNYPAVCSCCGKRRHHKNHRI